MMGWRVADHTCRRLRRPRRQPQRDKAPFSLASGSDQRASGARDETLTASIRRHSRYQLDKDFTVSEPASFAGAI